MVMSAKKPPLKLKFLLFCAFSGSSSHPKSQLVQDSLFMIRLLWYTKMKIEEISRRKNPVNREKSLQSRISFCKAQQLKLSYLGKFGKTKNPLIHNVLVIGPSFMLRMEYVELGFSPSLVSR